MFSNLTSWRGRSNHTGGRKLQTGIHAGERPGKSSTMLHEVGGCAPVPDLYTVVFCKFSGCGHVCRTVPTAPPFPQGWLMRQTCNGSRAHYYCFSEHAKLGSIGDPTELSMPCREAAQTSNDTVTRTDLFKSLHHHRPNTAFILLSPSQFIYSQHTISLTNFLLQTTWASTRT